MTDNAVWSSWRAVSMCHLFSNVSALTAPVNDCCHSICVCRVQDMTSRDLLQQRMTTSSGDTAWRLSPLVTAALEGSLAVLDGLHRVNAGTFAVLHRSHFYLWWLSYSFCVVDIVCDFIINAIAGGPMLSVAHYTGDWVMNYLQLDNGLHYRKVKFVFINVHISLKCFVSSLFLLPFLAELMHGKNKKQIDKFCNNFVF